ncbi:PLAT domain-containing protein 3-like [Neltuma alba]|uniref:PLAT domain-containing protein 3-like n=1 Tax=Neltuma alba TaxID=207710 RepID=UPI0010A4654E|nr:PLAT domain-containing protein 3-like [Prosopis alba]XP_028790937.1 PLAT domain-containing protein 3-like [Prosopis alba]
MATSVGNCSFSCYVIISFKLLFLLLSCVYACVYMQQQCQYIVRVKTGDRNDAGTDSIIGLKLTSSSVNSFTVNNLQSWGIMAPGHDYFERGNLDVFSGRGTCLSVCAVTVTSNGEGNKPGWYLDFVEITVSGGLSRKVAFPVNQWLALDEWPRHLYATVNLCSRAAATLV